MFTRERRMSVAAAAFIFRLKKPQLLRGVHQVLQVWGGLCKKFLGFLQEYLELYQRELVKGRYQRDKRGKKKKLNYISKLAF